MRAMVNQMVLLGLFVAVGVAAAADPFGSLTPADKALLKPQSERWIHDQVKHDWSDLWEIQDQTPELKNSLLLGRKEAPDMDRKYIHVKVENGKVLFGWPDGSASNVSSNRRSTGTGKRRFCQLL
jgi:serine protease inhibitor ecotin